MSERTFADKKGCKIEQAISTSDHPRRTRRDHPR